MKLASIIPAVAGAALHASRRTPRMSWSGEATKIAGLLLSESKAYRAEVALGVREGLLYSLLDAEDSTSHDITVLATSSDGSTNSETFTIAVTNLNDSGPGSLRAAIAGATAGASVLVFSATGLTFGGFAVRMALPTVAAAAAARLDATGQSCNAAKRFIVVDGLYDAFLTKFTAAMAASPLGDPTKEETVLGPLSSVEAATRLQGQVDRAVGVVEHGGAQHHVVHVRGQAAAQGREAVGEERIRTRLHDDSSRPAVVSSASVNRRMPSTPSMP